MTKWNVIIIISEKTLHCKLLCVEIQEVFVPFLGKILGKYSICSENFCPNGIKEDFGYVQVDEIALLLIPNLLSYDFFPGQTLI